MPQILLPSCPAPISHEDLRGYALRLAESNGYRSLMWLAKLTGGIKHQKASSHPSALSSITIKGLASITPYSSTQLAKTLTWPTVLSQRFYNLSWPRVCPACLAENAFVRRIWSITLVPVCPSHQLVLLANCPSCGGSLTWYRHRISFCDCGYDLRCATQPMVNPQVGALARFVAAKVTGLSSRNSKASGIDLPDQLLLLSPDNLLLTIAFLGGFSTAESTCNGNMKRSSCKLSVALQIIEGASLSLTDWPHNFHEILHSVLAKKAPTAKTGIRRAFGRPYTYLYKDIVDPQFDFLRQAFEAYLQSHWQGSLDHRYAVLQHETRASTQYVGTNTAGKILNLSPERIRALVRSGTLAGIVQTYPTGRSLTLIRRDALDNFKGVEVPRTTICVKSAAKILAIDKERVKELANAQILSKSAPDNPKGRRWALKLSDVTSLISDLTGNLPRKRRLTSNDNLIPLSRILKYYLNRNGNFPAFISAVKNNEIRPKGHLITLPGIKGALFSVDEVTEFLTRITIDGQSFTSKQCAFELGIGDRVIRHLMHIGLLKCVIVKRGHVLIRYVTIQNLNSFRLRYATTQDLVNVSELDKRTVTSMLRSAGVLPIVGVHIDGCHANIYARSEALAVLRKVAS